jgi:hypothetical protein
LIRFSLSGLPRASHLRIELDGEDLKWAPYPDIGVDRWHYDMVRDKKLDEGKHELTFWLGNEADERIAQLCSVEVIEYGDETE